MLAGMPRPDFAINCPPMRSSRASILHKVVFCLAAAIALGACSSPADPQAALKRFPIGLYGVGDSAHLDAIKEAGFDTVFAYASDGAGLARIARAARQKGLRLLLDVRTLDKGGPDTSGWPVDAWYLQDEPEINKVSPETLEKWSKKYRKIAPHGVQTFVIGDSAFAKPYAHIADLLMLDWYPVPHLALDSVADQIDETYRHLPEGKRLWMVVQAFDWRDDPPLVPGGKPRTVGRFPTHKEIRFMTYLSILHGAKGIFFFRFNQKKDGRTLLDRPEHWDAVRRVTRELKSLQKIFEKGRPIHLPFPPDPEGVEARAWRYRGRDYVIVLNRRKGFNLKFPKELLDPGWRPLFERRRDPRDLLKPKGKSWYLRPYDVLVLEGRFTPHG